MTEAFAAARFIKEIGRGKHGAKSMTQNDAQLLYAAMMEGRISDLEMGGILLAMRIKGETIEEIAGFMAAIDQKMNTLNLNAPSQCEFAPVIIPSYNGARKKANLTPLLALLLSKEGVPVLMHGVRVDAGRVSSAEIFHALNIPESKSIEEAQEKLIKNECVFMCIDKLSPELDRLLNMRRTLGVRNSTHTLVKILQPFKQAAVRLVSYTHPEYLTMLNDYFLQLAPTEKGSALLMRGTEGETVASTGRAQQITCYQQHQSTVLLETQSSLLEAQELPLIDAVSTACWIKQVLAGEIAVPQNIATQVALCKQAAFDLKQQST